MSYLLLGFCGDEPWSFVIFASPIFFTWGEIFSLFPSTCADTFWPRYATVNTALLYTAKGTSALLVPFANVLKVASGGWSTVLLITATVNFGVVLLALFVLKPLRAMHLSRADVLVGIEGRNTEKTRNSRVRVTNFFGPRLNRS